MRGRTIPLKSPAVSGQLDNTGGRVTRISLIETSGSNPATVYFYDGSSADGILLDVISLSAGQSTRDYYRLYQYPFEGGLYLDVIAGTVTGTVVVVHHDYGEAIGDPVVLVNPEVLSITLNPPA